MSTTRASLLRSVRDPGDGSAWARFYELYAPMLLGFARRRGLSHHDAEEVRDRCLAALARKMPVFEYRPELGRFQAFLFRMAVGHVCDLRRRERARAAVPLDDDVPSGDPADDWQAAWRDEHLRWALARATARASDRDARAFRALLAGCDATAVAAELGLRRNHVYKIKSRLLAEVRRLLERVQSH